MPHIKILNKNDIKAFDSPPEFNSEDRKNKLYYAFQELGKVVRSAYLLKYLRKPELRRTVNHATTVSERFNDFIQFVTFGNQGTIAANSRDEQRKIIKYGHLVASIWIFLMHDIAGIGSAPQLENQGMNMDIVAAVELPNCQAIKPLKGQKSLVTGGSSGIGNSYFSSVQVVSCLFIWIEP